jgi:hypothetical protein
VRRRNPNEKIRFDSDRCGLERDAGCRWVVRPTGRRRRPFRRWSSTIICQPISVDESAVCTKPSFGTEYPTVHSEPTFDWTRPVYAPFHAEPSLCGAASGHAPRSGDASVDSERWHPSQHRSGQAPERDWCPARTAALDAGLVQAGRVAIAQHPPEFATDRGTIAQYATRIATDRRTVADATEYR